MQIIEDYILSLLENSSKQKPVKRSEIQEKTHMNAKQIEQIVGELRDKGHFICGISSQKGYYLPRSEEEKKEFLREYTARAFTTLRRANKMRGI